jgi:hypothetical protein
MFGKYNSWRAAIIIFSLALILSPTIASPRRHSQATMGMKQGPSQQKDDVPSYDDPSKRGGEASYSEPVTTTLEVQVQPHGRSFDPDSTSAMAVRKRVTDLDEMLKLQDQELDRKLVICRHC